MSEPGAVNPVRELEPRRDCGEISPSEGCILASAWTLDEIEILETSLTF